ncbi:hypothetical protein SAMN03080606_04349 [Alkaliphilus peptidifermentans DSM 18978]|uniref:Uncharacterized protein n=1 Tax=Alkaliphilus peptidifermentans DSM 18978 TaxID=1120976 RepID=A0A1G5LEI8_9FIRM|nr:hypothetical protein [Alkaliphilus peptidifermentans]SCZ11226.1 hypothetical protein SAMN03080606_04349 [Alkaliphilus peptidifermentans DSM 18978]
MTVYRNAHDEASHFWIELDKFTIFDASELRWMVRYYKLSDEIREVTGNTDWRDPNQKEEYYKAYDYAEKILERQGIYSDTYFYAALEEYISKPIEDIIISEYIVVRALGMIDRRLGKRRLQKINKDELNNGLVRLLFEIRC